jgi:hypothetical protein
MLTDLTDQHNCAIICASKKCAEQKVFRDIIDLTDQRNYAIIYVRQGSGSE